MSLRFLSVVPLVAAAAVIVGCESRSQPVSPSTVDTAPAAVVAGPAQAEMKGTSQHVVGLFDACDPETFNAALGAGACTRSGGVRFDTFLEQLGQHHSIGAWHFAPTNVTMKLGELLVATNRGGEEHTFTEVEEFGGGVVPILNQLSGNTEVAPECAAITLSDRIPPGGTASDEVEETGTELYQCCIHPWMRTTVTARR